MAFVTNSLNFPNLTSKASPVGADLMMIADSAASNALKQITISSLPGTGPINSLSTTFGIGNSATNFRVPINSTPSTSASLVLVANTIYCMPMNIPISTTFTKIGIVTQNTVVGNMRLGIYDNTGPGGFPGARVLDAGTVNTNSVATLTITISQLLLGNYWIVGIANALANVSGIIGGTNNLGAHQLVGSSSVTAATPAGSVAGLSEASVSGYFTALPSSLSSDTFTLVASLAAGTPTLPLIFLQK